MRKGYNSSRTLKVLGFLVVLFMITKKITIEECRKRLSGLEGKGHQSGILLYIPEVEKIVSIYFDSIKDEKRDMEFTAKKIRIDVSFFAHAEFELDACHYGSFRVEERDDVSDISLFVEDSLNLVYGCIPDFVPLTYFIYTEKTGIVYPECQTHKKLSNEECRERLKAYSAKDPYGGMLIFMTDAKEFVAASFGDGFNLMEDFDDYVYCSSFIYELHGFTENFGAQLDFRYKEVDYDTDITRAIYDAMEISGYIGNDFIPLLFFRMNAGKNI